MNKISSTTGPGVTAEIDRCFIDPKLGNQASADVTVVNHSSAVHDIVVTIRMGADEGTHEDLAYVHSVAPGQAGTGGTTNHIDNSHHPTCVITGVQGL